MTTTRQDETLGHCHANLHRTCDLPLLRLVSGGLDVSILMVVAVGGDARDLEVDADTEATP